MGPGLPGRPPSPATPALLVVVLLELRDRARRSDAPEIREELPRERAAAPLHPVLEPVLEAEIAARPAVEERVAHHRLVRRGQAVRDRARVHLVAKADEHDAHGDALGLDLEAARGEAREARPSAARAGGRPGATTALKPRTASGRNLPMAGPRETREVPPRQNRQETPGARPTDRTTSPAVPLEGAGARRDLHLLSRVSTSWSIERMKNSSVSRMPSAAGVPEMGTLNSRSYVFIQCATKRSYGFCRPQASAMYA